MFDPYWDAKNQMLGEPKLLKKDYLQHIFDEEGDSNYATSPGLLDRMLTNRNPRKLARKLKSAGS